MFFYFQIVFACFVAAASAVPTSYVAQAPVLLASPAAVTYQTSKQSLVPVGTSVQTLVSQPLITKTLSAPILASPYATGLPIAQAGLVSPLAGLGYGVPALSPLAVGGHGLISGLATPLTGLPLGSYGSPYGAVGLKGVY